MSRSLKKVALGVVIVLASGSAVAAQQTSPLQQSTPPADTETIGLPPKIDELNALRAQAGAAKDLSEADKKNVLSLLDRGIRFLEETERLNADTQQFIQKIKNAPTRTEEIQIELRRKVPATDQIVDPAKAAQLTNAELEQRERDEKASLIAARESLNNLQDQIEALKGRPVQLQKDSADAMRRLREVRKELRDDSSASNEPGILAEARRAALLAEHAMLKTRIDSYEQQLKNNEIFVSLLAVERDLANLEVTRREARDQALHAITQQRRQNEASQARMEAEASIISASDVPLVVKEQYEINIELSKTLEQTTHDETQTAQKLDDLQSELKTLQEEFAHIRQRVQGVSLSETMGLTLRQRLWELPGPQSYRRNSAQRQIVISQVSDAQFAIGEKRRDLADIKAETEKILQSLTPTPEENAAKWQDRIQTLLLDRRDLLDKLQNSYRRYYQNLQSLEFAEQRMSALIDDYAGFLDGHLLWIGSAKVFGPSDLRQLPAAFLWLVNPDSWWLLLKDLIASFGHATIFWMLGLLVALLLFIGRRRAKNNLEQITKSVGRVRKDSLMLTIRAIGLTLYLAAGRPFLLVLVGWRLSALPVASDFSRAAGYGLLVAGYVWAILSFIHYLCHEYGVARFHFRWAKVLRLALHRQLLWLTPLWVPLVFLIATFEAANKIAFGNSLGRLAFLIGMTATAVCAARIFQIAAGQPADTAPDASPGLLRRQRYIWYPLLIGLPGLLVILAGMGYYYTALRLDWAFQNTALLILALVLGNNLALRGLVIAQRRLAYEEEVRKRKEKLEAERAQEGDLPSSVGETPIESFEMEEPEVSQAQITEQTRALLQTILLFSGLVGLWVIWHDVLPAMSVLGDIRLWGYSVEVDGVTKVMPITLVSVLLAVLIAIITFVTARNLPGVLEISLLKYLPLDAGARYAFSTICQYVVSAIGLIIASKYIGINWGSLKWLVAALGVGIGFGLQEIIANFISGLIILFERPVRVGDIVTVDNIDGVISRIQIRATTITNWDRKEYIVPNKEFITGRVLNWTLSNPLSRIVLPVGIAYGSDTELARELLLKTAEEHPNVLGDPAPMAAFEGFGDNALNFTLRCFLPNLDNRIATVSELHQAIDKAFREAGISIAFPQRDVHLDSTRPLEVRFMPEKNPADDAGPQTDGSKAPPTEDK
jgi:potassium efflux system protein